MVIREEANDGGRLDKGSVCRRCGTALPPHKESLGERAGGDRISWLVADGPATHGEMCRSGLHLYVPDCQQG